MRLIDAEDYLYRERPVGLSDELYQESHLYKSIMEQEVIQAIPLDKIKQAREEMNDLDYLINDAKYSDWETRVCNVDILVNEFYEIMDKLIAESEE